jgi:hypothetical protein
LEGTDVEKLLKEKGLGLKAVTAKQQKKVNREDEPLKAAIKDDWKKKSNAFRDAIKSSREYEQAKKEGRYRTKYIYLYIDIDI